ncbi:hypothetical protein FQN54_006218 [Arachnomyces sp. PD_36]|nr:hypothetical protein FQN54_006218 [Arachnomyces sp. PD_36]
MAEIPEDCVPGEFYGFPDTEDEEDYLHPGETFQLQWGAYEDGAALNVTLVRGGGAFVAPIAEGAVFSTSSSLYRLYSPSDGCTLQQYNWTIPSDLDTSNPRYQLGLFNADTERGADGVELAGFLSWSPYFYLGPEPEPTSAPTTLIATDNGRPTETSAPANSITSSPSPSPPPSSSSGLSTGATAGIAAGAGVVGLALLIFLFWFFRRRRSAAKAAPPYVASQDEKRPISTQKAPVPRQTVIHEMDAGNAGFNEAPGDLLNRELDGRRR